MTETESRTAQLMSGSGWFLRTWTASYKEIALLCSRRATLNLKSCRFFSDAAIETFDGDAGVAVIRLRSLVGCRPGRTDSE